ncbi:bifunctional methylenetetrahydrofolate dehydrogenase/methenyltetrahydrofolate cyclohydrolase [Clostridium sp. SYSU_GA19001]|uniref:bifunctional 5,10-methylenetetrahydrofolate dehydrogenase/5,10-methenyltetrahydrofolate cyclohydrolase n=1 Tax=Clostridium caldaquaticum TaxID=2940653 RepID=UPI0020773A3D|nr:tetrahydrofolate dehydrogenase/cyclohydrolase catalytic domain-containing protein [Clostridium caldaquaticum]MCM8711046.1 bifunctional methylenetetrahydrofolate dehydrogenase/methenyltetrahydrofolate cyclohydrolase [Clostridium caldaquaticum]
MGNIIDGKVIAKNLKMEIKEQIDKKKAEGLRGPCLAAVLAGSDGGSISYTNNQKKLCDELGVEYRKISLSDKVSEKEFLELLDRLNNDKEVDGIIIQLPLPKHLDEKKITSRLSYLKDVDGLTDINLGKFYKGESSFVPCTPQSIIKLIKNTGCSIEGKHAVVVGRSNIVGKPAAALLLSENATVTICHSKTKNLKEVCKSADILVCALGKPSFINKEYVKEGAIVIDVGTTMVEGKIKGDVLFDEVMPIASFLTPVPGGVGAMTTTMLIKNTCEAWIKNVY